MPTIFLKLWLFVAAGSADAVSVFLIFLHLLESDAYQVAKPPPSHFVKEQPHADARSNVYVDRVALFVFYSFCHQRRPISFSKTPRSNSAPSRFQNDNF